MTAGIYLITNTVTGDRYVGQSRDIENRWKVHQHRLRGSKHHNRLLQRDWQRYGMEVFELSILQVIDPESLESSEYHPRFRLRYILKAEEKRWRAELEPEYNINQSERMIEAWHGRRKRDRC
jgi:group I intron endonuclease